MVEYHRTVIAIVDYISKIWYNTISIIIADYGGFRGSGLHFIVTVFFLNTVMLALLNALVE